MLLYCIEGVVIPAQYTATFSRSIVLNETVLHEEKINIMLHKI